MARPRPFRRDARRRARSIRVRMYRVGFGDCFLVSFLGRPTKHVLVDCGVHKRGDIGKLEAVVENIATETKGKLALVVATHAHEDHISGFGKYAERFHAMKVEQVWMPWCENPEDKVA